MIKFERATFVLFADDKFYVKLIIESIFYRVQYSVSKLPETVIIILHRLEVWVSS